MKYTLKKYKDPIWGMVDDFNKFAEDLNFNSFFDYPYYKGVNNIGKVNIIDNDKDYTIDVSVPGFTKDELKVDLNDGILTVSGEHNIEKKDDKVNYSRKEFSKKSFSRSFNVPDSMNTDELDAKLENGILSLSIKKKELPPKQEPKRIEIK